MTVEELLQLVNDKLDIIHGDNTFLIFSLAIVVGLILVVLFGMAWGRNT